MADLLDSATPDDPEALEGSGGEESLLDSLGAAYDELAAEPSDADPAPPSKETEEPAADADKPKEGKARDEAGRFAKGAKADPAAATVKPVLAPTKAGAPPPVTAPQPASAPQSFKPAAREKWAATPPEIQQEVLRREAELEAQLHDSTDARKGFDAYRQTVAPYEGMIRAQGGEPLAAIGNLLQTAAVLNQGRPEQKVQIIANMIKNWGIDVAALDGVLAGEQPAPGTQGAYRDPRVDGLLQQLAQSQQQRSEQTRQQFTTEVATFRQSHEFFTDVQQDMADLIEMAAKRGKALDMEAAYTQACKLHPDVSGVLAQREAAKAATAGRASTQRARAAASSVHTSGGRGSGNHASANETVHGALEAAWDELAQ